MQAQAEAAIKDFFSGPPGEKLKTAATAQLTLALLTTFWVPNLSGALAVLGLLSVTLSNIRVPPPGESRRLSVPGDPEVPVVHQAPSKYYLHLLPS